MGTSCWAFLQAYLVIVGWHPCEQDERAPVVAEVGEDERPDRAFAEDRLPWDAPYGALWQVHPQSAIECLFWQSQGYILLTNDVGSPSLL